MPKIRDETESVCSYSALGQRETSCDQQSKSNNNMHYTIRFFLFPYTTIAADLLLKLIYF